MDTLVQDCLLWECQLDNDQEKWRRSGGGQELTTIEACLGHGYSDH